MRGTLLELPWSRVAQPADSLAKCGAFGLEMYKKMVAMVAGLLSSRATFSLVHSFIAGQTDAAVFLRRQVGVGVCVCGCVCGCVCVCVYVCVCARAYVSMRA